MVKLVSKIIFLFSVHSYFPIHSICKVSSISTYVKWADKKEKQADAFSSLFILDVTT